MQIQLPVEIETVTLLTPNKILMATKVNGRLVHVNGVKADVEQIELDMVKATRGGQEIFIELGPRIRWLDEEEEVEFNGKLR